MLQIKVFCVIENIIIILFDSLCYYEYPLKGTKNDFE